jgi:hypothetical protein
MVGYFGECHQPIASLGVDDLISVVEMAKEYKGVWGS